MMLTISLSSNLKSKCELIALKALCESVKKFSIFMDKALDDISLGKSMICFN